jgi:Na+/H+ antiporter NhaD/arsenite permease-like protein
MDVIAAIDFEVLILLSSIMIINHIVIHLRETKNLIEYFQSIIQKSPQYGFWLLSFVAFAVSPFLTNDGVCLLFVEPVLHIFEEVKRNVQTDRHAVAVNAKATQENVASQRVKDLRNSDALYFLLALACSTNIGSALTYTGNPQNMIVASDALGVMPSYKFLAYMIIPSLVTWFISKFVKV